MTKPGFEAVILDLDGVITRTAALHARAWKTMFDRYLESRQARNEEGHFEPFDADRDYVDGRPRYDGVRSFLDSRGIDLPEGDAEDEPGTETIRGLGSWKNEIYLELLKKQGAEVFPDAVRFIERCKQLGMKTGVVSSSRNCAAVLDSAELTDWFDVRVDGTDLKRLGLEGKPEPDLFLEAARRQNVEPKNAAVFEDSVAGVEAGRKGGFGLVVGVDRAGDGRNLIEHGAHIAVRTLDELQWPGVRLSELASERAGSDGRHRLKEEIRQSIAARRLAVFLDYDGTLTPIVRDPDEAILSNSMRETIRNLASTCRVAIVSGRDRKDVERLVRLDELIYAGSHGFDIAGPGGLRMEHEEAKSHLPSLDAAERELGRSLEDVSGVRIERKRYAVAIHYRNTPEGEVAKVRRRVEEVASNHTDLQKRGGKKVFELLPDLDWDKGMAVKWLLRALDLWSSDVLPIYVGDDRTDEDAFRALEGYSLRFVVGPLEHETAADYYLKDVAEVERLLREITNIGKGAK